MLKAKVSSFVVAGSLLLGVAGSASADETYAGLSLGHTEVDEFCEGAGSGCDDSALSLRVYGGGFIDKNLAFEGGYSYIDDVSGSIELSGLGTFSADLSHHTFDGSLLVFTPGLGPVRLFAKAGVLFWQQDLEARLSGFGSASDTERGVAFRTGVGATVEVVESLRLRLEWDLLMDVGDDDSFESDIHVVSAGPELVF